MRFKFCMSMDRDIALRTVFLCEDIFIPDAYKISKTGFGAIDRAFKVKR